MSKILLIASVVLLLASAGLGFVNKTKIAAKQDELERTKTVVKTAQNDAATAKTKQKKAEKDASDAVSKSNDLQTQLTAATTQVTTLNGQVDEAKKNVESKDGEIAQLKDTISKTALSGTATTPGAGAADANKLQELEIQLTEMKAVKDQLESQAKSGQTQIAALTKRITDRETGASMNGLSGRILAVNRDWNFVILSLGNRQGVNSNATMIVQRGGSTVGKVRITSVEPSQSIADIIPNSVPAGINVQPGDTVVYSGSL